MDHVRTSTTLTESFARVLRVNLDSVVFVRRADPLVLHSNRELVASVVRRDLDWSVALVHVVLVVESRGATIHSEVGYGVVHTLPIAHGASGASRRHEGVRVCLHGEVDVRVERVWSEIEVLPTRVIADLVVPGLNEAFSRPLVADFVVVEALSVLEGSHRGYKETRSGLVSVSWIEAVGNLGDEGISPSGVALVPVPVVAGGTPRVPHQNHLVNGV